MLTILLLAGALAATAPPQPRSGIWQYDQRSGQSSFIGAAAAPTIDPANLRLYAVNTDGAIVRWSLEALDQPPAVVAAPGDGPGYQWPLAAPVGGQVAAFRAFGLRDGDQRLCLDILDAAGTRLRGPLPLQITRASWQGRHLACWHPDGQHIAFGLTEGSPRKGIYVFEPGDKNWVLATAFPQGFAEPMPIIRFEGQGRTMSYSLGGKLYLSGGADWASYRNFEVPGRLHTWLNQETIIVYSAADGALVYDITGARAGRIEGWPTGDVLRCSEIGVSPHGLAWVRPAAERGMLELVVRALPGGQLTVAARFGGGGKPYGLLAGAPVWHPSQPLVYYWVP